jgi:hypothetical protein
MELDVQRIAAELGRAKFKDKRLASRLQLLGLRLSASPSLSFPKALANSAELEAAYRFFGNPVVTPEGILSGHVEATRERCLPESVVLVLHDTTKVAYREDGERVLGGGKQSFFAHSALAVTDDQRRLPLGICGLHTWVRGLDADEYARWGEMVDTASSNLAGATLVHVMDREGDDYDLLCQLVSGNHRFIIRSTHDRNLVNAAVNAAKLHEALASVEAIVQRDAKLSRRKSSKLPRTKQIYPPRTARKALLSMGAMSVTLKRPRVQSRHTEAERNRHRALPEQLTLNVVRVWEEHPPEDEPAVEWMLLTTEPIDDALRLERIVERYRARWTIEEFFKALKTGCAYETRQLQDYESLVNALAVFAPIACSILALRSESRRASDGPQTVLTQTQVEVLQALGRTTLPTEPTNHDVLLAVAALGGHIKYNGPPGWQTLHAGYVELLTLTRGWEAAKLQLSRDQ